MKEILITLHKEQINVEENVIKSFILEGNRKIGYIYLPAFYSQMNSIVYSPNGCANDVAKELIKLKREGINGLIIDLRNNGGGSMLEAIQLAGIFINYGALCIVHSRQEDPVTTKDINRGTIYNDPLIILQNLFSASASELFAAAMQDHNRAIIAGANSFGKSTAQEILPIDAYKYNRFTNINGTSKGYLKLTRSKFYRVNGKSHQKEGIIPDIKLPDIYDDIDVGESFLKSALDPSTIEKKTYYFPYDPLPIKKLRASSEHRVNNDSAFIYIKKMSKLLSEQQKQYSIPLKYESFKAYYNSSSLINEYEKSFREEKTMFLVTNPSYMKGISSITDSKMEINDNAMKQIQKDIYIKEAYNVINDLIDLTIK